METERDVRAWVRDEVKRVEDRRWTSDHWAGFWAVVIIFSALSLFPAYWLTHDAVGHCSAACKDKMGKWTESHTEPGGKFTIPESCECRP